MENELILEFQSQDTGDKNENKFIIASLLVLFATITISLIIASLLDIKFLINFGFVIGLIGFFIVLFKYFWDLLYKQKT